MNKTSDGLVPAFRAVLDANGALVRQLRDEGARALGWDEAGIELADEMVIEHLANVRCGDDEADSFGDGRKAVRVLGVIAASPEALRLAALANTARQAFKTAVSTFKQTHEDEVTPDKLSKILDLSAEVREHLSYAGGGRVHVLGATRRLPVLGRMPAAMSFFWHQGNFAYEATTRDYALGRVQRLIAQAKEAKRPRLAAELEDELAMLVSRPAEEWHESMPARARVGLIEQRRRLPPSPRVNLVYPDEPGVNPRQQVYAPVPLLVPGGADWPRIKPPRAKGDPADRRGRGDAGGSHQMLAPLSELCRRLRAPGRRKG